MGDANVAAIQASSRIQAAFAEKYKEFACLFRVETFLVRNLGTGIAASGNRPLVALTRRLLSSGQWETFAKLKGVNKDPSNDDLDRLSSSLRATHDMHSA